MGRERLAGGDKTFLQLRLFRPQTRCRDKCELVRAHGALVSVQIHARSGMSCLIYNGIWGQLFTWKYWLLGQHLAGMPRAEAANVQQVRCEPEDCGALNTCSGPGNDPPLGTCPSCVRPGSRMPSGRLAPQATLSAVRGHFPVQERKWHILQK